MTRKVLGCILMVSFLSVGLGVGGCSWKQQVRDFRRPVNLEIKTPEGIWRMEEVDKVQLQLTGWEIRVVKSQVGDLNEKVPTLQKLHLEIVNTSSDMVLVLMPGAVKIDGHPSAISVGPRGPLKLEASKSHPFVYKPGLMADTIPYPFCVRIRAEFRNSSGATDGIPVEAVLRFY